MKITIENYKYKGKSYDKLEVDLSATEDLDGFPWDRFMDTFVKDAAWASEIEE